MLHVRVSLLLLPFLVLSKNFNKATSIPLSEINQRHIVPETKAPRQSPEYNPLLPNTLIHGVPDDLFLAPSPTVEPVLDLYQNKFGLWPSDHTQPEKTVLLNNGKAKFDATFSLVLREGEDLKGMRHRSNDTSIISSFEESKERHEAHVVSYNITLTHHFKGTVGAAEYELTIFTTMGATLRAAGIYYVSGVVVYASTESMPLRKVSGTNASPLSVDSMDSFSHMTKSDFVRFPLRLQQVGPDVRLKPASFADVLSSAKITVASPPSDKMPILINNARKCKTMAKNLSIRQNGRADWENCDVRFDYDSMSLVLKLHPERYGKAIIDIAFPSLRTEREVFKTEIRLKITQPAIRAPELIVKKDVHLQLDHYGTESFSLQLKSEKTSGHRREVLSYVMDLPGNRYATADFASSSLDGPVHNISFTVVSPGHEDKVLQEKIRHPLRVYADTHKGDKNRTPALVNIRLMDTGRNQSHLPLGYRESAKTIVSSVDFASYQLYNRMDYSGAFDVIPVSRNSERTHEYMSHVYAVFPNFDELVTVEIPSGSALWTSFASKKMAMVEALPVRRDFQNLLVKVILLQYTVSTFSQHKSTQISKYLSKEISILSGSSTEPATLVMLEDKGVNIESSYHVLVSQEYTDAVMDLNKLKKNISSGIASNVLLKDGRVMVSDIIRLAVPSKILGRPTNVNITTSEEADQYKGVSGPLVGVIVGVAMIIVIPLLIFCAGYMLARSYSEEEPSNFDGGSRREALQIGKVKKSREDPQAATDVLRDNYGRADDDSYESFKVRTELTKQGYYGANDRKDKSRYVAKL